MPMFLDNPQVQAANAARWPWERLGSARSSASRSGGRLAECPGGRLSEMLSESPLKRAVTASLSWS